MPIVPVADIYAAYEAQDAKQPKKSFVQIVKQLESVGFTLPSMWDTKEHVVKRCIKSFTRDEITEYINWFYDINKDTFYKGYYYKLVLEVGDIDLDQATNLWSKIDAMKNVEASSALKHLCEKHIKHLKAEIKFADYDDLEKENRELKAELEKQKQANTDVSNKFDTLRVIFAVTEAQLRDITASKDALAKECAGLTKELTGYRAKKAEMREMFDAMTKALASLRSTD